MVIVVVIITVIVIVIVIVLVMVLVLSSPTLSEMESVFDSRHPTKTAHAQAPLNAASSKISGPEG